MLIMLPRAMLRVCGPACHLPFGRRAAMRESGTKWQDYSLSKAVITGAAALALVAGGTAAGAAITSSPVDGNAVIHGCYMMRPTDDVSALQDAGTTCPKGTTAISWSQTGPAGATGPAGPRRHAGSGQDHQATGPAGPAGPAR